MIIHYLYSNKKVASSAKITFNGEVQRHCLLVDDQKGMIIRRTFKSGEISGRETLYGEVTIELPDDVRGGPYKTNTSARDSKGDGRG